MIVAMLQSNPEKRPSIGHLMKFEFLTKGSIPKSLPASCLSTAPRVDHQEDQSGFVRRPLTEFNGMLGRTYYIYMECFFFTLFFVCFKVDETRFDSSFLKNNLHDAITASGTMPRHNDNCRTHIEDLYAQLSKLIAKKVRN
jgi:polo-like kinase 1